MATATLDRRSGLVNPGRLVIALLAGTLMAPTLVVDVADADEQRKRPRVEDVAVRVAADLGDDAPTAVLRALDDGASLRTVVRRIEQGTLAPADPNDAAPTATTAPADAEEPEGNPVVVITERGIRPPTVTVDPSSPLIVANNGAKVHVVEIEGTKLQQHPSRRARWASTSSTASNPAGTPFAASSLGTANRRC